MEDRTWTVTWGKDSDLIASLRENEQFIRKGGKQKKNLVVLEYVGSWVYQWKEAPSK